MTDTETVKKLGIIGGLGPGATARLFSRIVDLTVADRDQEHLDTVVLNLPTIPDRTAYLLGEPGARSFIEPMNEAARLLESLGCTVLATPCNTAHAKLDDIACGLEHARFVSMPISTAAFLESLGAHRVGILATDGALFTGVYQDALRSHGMEYLVPDEDAQAIVMSVIYDDVKAGTCFSPKRIQGVCDGLIAQGADAIVLGCTELSLLGMPELYEGARVVDALDVLAFSCIRACGAQARELSERYKVQDQIGY